MTAIDLGGKTALVTGGGQGLGAATAEALAAAGARVVINYFDDPQGVNRERAEQTASAIGPAAARWRPTCGTPPRSRRCSTPSAARFGGLDIVVNNAAILRDRSVKKMSDEEWRQVIDTNLTGVFNVSRLAAERLADGGRIVNLSSISAFEGFFGQANYAAAKAGVAALTRVLARELARRRITVNAVAPGVVLTEMGKSIPEEVRAEMLTVHPPGQVRRAGRDRGGDPLPLQRPRLVRHRPGHPRERGVVGMSAGARRPVCTADEAAALIADGQTVACSGFVGSAHPEALTAAIERRFLRRRRARGTSPSCTRPGRATGRAGA